MSSLGITDISVGDVVLLTNGTVLLVGDINTLGGVCDDCEYNHGDAEVSEVIPCSMKALEFWMARKR